MTDRTDETLIARLEALGHEDAPGDWAEVRRRAERLSAAPPRLRRGLVAVVAAVLLAVTAIAAPALGLDDAIVRFFESEPAPKAVKESFARLDEGAPIPEWRTGVIAGETRIVMKAYFGDKWHTLSVAPTKYGGFCEQWSNAGGGCDRLGTVPLGVSYGSSGAFRLDDGRPPPLDEITDYLFGFAHSRWVHAVELRFEDGDVVHPEIVWVGEPIDAGFFAYDIPKERRRDGHRLSAVVALDAEGDVVTQDSFPPERRMPAPQPDALVDEKERVLAITTAQGDATIWSAPTRYEGTCIWLEFDGKETALNRCLPKGYEHDGGIASRFLPSRETVLFYASVGPRVAAIEVLYADGDRARVVPHDGYALYEVPQSHYREGHRASELIFRDHAQQQITRIDVSRFQGPRAACWTPVPLADDTARSCP